MSINSAIISALSSISLPCVADEYIGTDNEYLTFNYYSKGDAFSDNRGKRERFSVQVHYVCPVTLDSLAKRKSIRNALIAAGFTFPLVTPDNDAEGQHWIFECEKMEAL